MVIENLRAEVLLALLVACAALAGAAGWFLQRFGEAARRQAHEATSREYVRAAGRARDRARAEADEVTERMERLREEHASCSERIEQLTAALARVRGRVEQSENALGSAQGDANKRTRKITALQTDVRALTEERDALARRCEEATAAAAAAVEELDAVRNAHAVCEDTIQRLRDEASDLDRRIRARDEENRKGAPAWLLATPPPRSDDLKAIRGLGPALERDLNALGVYLYSQLAGMTDAESDWIEARINTLPGAIRRFRWVDQAKMLAARAQRESRKRA